jgi:hypothetical protein
VKGKFMDVPSFANGKQSSLLSNIAYACGSAAAGAAVMYLLDPVSGSRRRARVREQGVHAKNVSLKFAGRKGRHLRNRAKGVVHELVSGFKSEAA